MKTNSKKILSNVVIVTIIMAMLLAMSVDGASAATKPKKIYITPTSKTLTVGQTTTIKVKKVYPSKASKLVYYKSSNKAIATVSSKGLVTAKKAGKVTITVTSKKSSKVKAKATITVKAKPVSKKALVIYFTHGENVLNPYAAYEKYKDDFDELAGASLLKDDDGRIVGNTGLAASWIADTVNAKTYSIHVTRVNEDTELYPITKRETQDFFRNYEQPQGTNPDIASLTKEDPDFSQYDVIYLGFPNWDGEPPHAIYTFIDQNKDALNGKTIAIFNPGHFTSRGFAEALLIVKSKLPNSPVLSNQLLYAMADFSDENIATTKAATIQWAKDTMAEASSTKPEDRQEITGQKALAEAIIGQTMSAKEIEQVVGKCNKKQVDKNGCNHDVASVRLYYDGFVIYTRPVGINDDNISEVSDDSELEIFAVN